LLGARWSAWPVISAVAEFERDLLVERTRAGLSRARAQGKKLSRPSSLTSEQMKVIRESRRAGASLGSLAGEFGVSRSAIQRLDGKTGTGGPVIEPGGNGAAVRHRRMKLGPVADAAGRTVIMGWLLNPA